MTATLNIADILFMFDQVLAGDTPAPGADPLAPIGIRAIDGTNNNITGLTLVDQFGNVVDSSTFGNVNQAFVNWTNSTSPLAYYDQLNPGVISTGSVVTDGSERLISNLIADMSAYNPATATADLLTPGDPAVDRLPENSLFTFFGQFFDHGLDFINKGGNGTVMVPVMASDPLSQHPSFNPFAAFVPVTRATLHDGVTPGLSTNSTAPYIEQSQTYGSEATTTFYLMEYDVNGDPTGNLVHGANGMATWADIKANALQWAVAQHLATPGSVMPTAMLTDAHVLDIPDPALWDVMSGTFAPNAGTGQAFIADIAHNANPGGGLTPDADSIINPNGMNADGTLAPPPAPGEYDNELLDAHFVSGDPRVNENTALTSIHKAFHDEHSRILAQLEDWIAQQNQVDPTFAAQWTGEMKFQAVKIANEMQYQHLVFEEFGRRMSPNIDAFAAYDVNINPNITREFSQAIYRLGHSQLSDGVKTMNASGDMVDLTLVDAFLDPETFTQFGAGDFLMGGQFEQGAQIDEFVDDSLRNFLVGLPLDLATTNIVRGRELGLPSLNQLRADLFAQTGESTLRPYDSWADFGANLLNPGSLVNFLAAYGTDAGGLLAAARTAVLTAANPTAGQAATNALRALAQSMIDSNDAVMTDLAATSGLDTVDLWMGGLAEKKVPLGLLGSTFDFIFAQQMIALQNGDRFYYLGRIGGNLLSEIEGQTLSDILMRSGDAIHLHGDVFGTPDVLIELGATGATDLLKTPAEEVLYVSEIIGGTHAANTIEGGAGNDQIFGEGGNDTLYGGENDDHVYGGRGNDVIWGDLGFDKLRGDAGNDEIHGGADDDIMNGNTGNDTMFGDAGFDELFGGDGNDELHGGSQDDGLLGMEGHDTLYGDAGDDGLDGGEGNDVLFGGFGTDLLQGFGGDDMLFGGAGADAMDGGLGYDIASYADWGGPTGLNINMQNSLLSTGDANGDTYLGIEELRGTNNADTIIGDNLVGMVLSGGGGNDTITGGALDDVFIGGAGNDRLIANALGVDTALYLGNEADFTIVGLGNNVITITDNVNGQGTDTLIGVDWLMFDDGLLNTQTLEYAPLLGISGTHERVQHGYTIIGELERDVNFLDGQAVPGTGIVVGVLQVTDPDGANGPRTFVLGGPDAALFSVVANGPNQELRFIGGGAGSFVNYEVKPYYNVSVTVTDATGSSAVNLTVNVTDVNDNAPVMTGAHRVNISEGVATNSIVYLANATDLDTTGQNITFQLTGDDAALFDVAHFNATGELKFLASPSFGTPADLNGDNIYDVSIVATDGTNVSAVAHDLHVHVTQPAGFQVHAVPGQFNLIQGTFATDLDPFLIGTGGDDHIVAFGGNDRANGRYGNDWLEGGEGNDGMYGDRGDDTLQGGNGDDYLNGGVGADVMDGGAGNDTASWKFSTVGVNANIATGAVSGGSGDGDQIFGIENLQGSSLGNDTLTGDDGVNRLYGLEGNDVLNGGGGNDVMYGGIGNDTLNGGDNDDFLVGGVGADSFDGGNGIDTAYYAHTNVAITVDLGAGTGAGGEAAGDTFVNVENVSGSGQGDTLIGNALGNRLLGNNGNDTISGAAGNDVIYGGSGSDLINGGANNDFLVGGGDADTFEFDAAWGADTIGDWVKGVDILDLSNTGLVFANLTISATGVSGEHALISDGTNTIRLNNTDFTTVQETDFFFGP